MKEVGMGQGAIRFRLPRTFEDRHYLLSSLVHVNRHY